jgi:hypothetical protein
MTDADLMGPVVMHIVDFTLHARTQQTQNHGNTSPGKYYPEGHPRLLQAVEIYL